MRIGNKIGVLIPIARVACCQEEGDVIGCVQLFLPDHVMTVHVHVCAK